MEGVECTPKLLLSRLPSKAKEALIISQTPLFNNLASIPFQWEVAPGKPRAAISLPPPPSSSSSNTSVAQCLDLPPRLLNNNLPSQAEEVVNAPGSCTCIRRSLSELPLFCMSKGSLVSPEEKIDIHGISDCKEITRLKSGFSCNWRSLKGTSGVVCKASRHHDRGVKINRVRRSSIISSFLTVSLGDVYGSFKHVVPWGWRQQ